MTTTYGFENIKNSKNNIFTNFRDATDRYIIYADVCGVPKEEIDIQIEGQVLMIHAVRDFGVNTGFHTTDEIHNGNLCRVIELKSDLDINNVVAEYQHGLLKITIPKKKEKTTVKVKIQ